jgi:hypothetical protein
LQYNGRWFQAVCMGVERAVAPILPHC